MCAGLNDIYLHIKKGNNMTTFADGLAQYGGMPVGPAGVPVPFDGTWWFVDPIAGRDGNGGNSPQDALATLYQAHSRAADSNNDVVVLLSNGLSTGSSRLSTASAQTIDSTVTAGTLVWSKNALHLIGVSSPSNNSRARIAPPTGTYTQATFGSGNFVTVSGSGCYFSNLSVYNGFSTGGTNQIAWTDSGERNVYQNCQFQGMNDAASAANTGSRSLKVGGAGTGENRFINCIIGDDTTTRTVANASLELTGGTPRNSFERCIFPVQGSAAGVLGILGTGAACIDRWNLFDRCVFINNIKSTSTQMTVLASLTSASSGGMLVFKDCDTIGMTKIGDTNALANSYVSNVGGAATGGLDVNPS